MSLILLAIRLLLAVIFLTSALAKLKDRAGSKQALLDFGLPPLFVSPFSIVLPLAEITVAIALLLVSSAWWGAIGAIVLLLLFIGGIAVNLARGRTPDCHCFGQIHSEPIGWPTLVRNFALIMMAGFIVMQGPDNDGVSITGWLTTLTAIQWATLFFSIFVLVLLIIEGWFLIHLLRQNGRLLLRIESLEAQLLFASTKQPETNSSTPQKSKKQVGLVVGTLAPAFSLSDLHGNVLSLDSMRSTGKPILLVFSDPKCGPCISLMPKIAIWQREYVRSLTVAVISRGSRKDNLIKVAEHGLSNVFVQRDSEVADTYLIKGTPSAVLILAKGTVGSPIAIGVEAISQLVDETLIEPSTHLVMNANGNNKTGKVNAQVSAIRIAIGDVAPSFELHDLAGKLVNLIDFHGTETLILFWNPACSFCMHMLNALKAWENNVTQESPELLIVSTGSVEANREMGLRSTIVLDQAFTVGHKYGVGGTPSAVLVNDKNRVASRLVIGRQEILNLLIGQSVMKPLSENHSE